jgi:hypothetical protein
MSLFLEEKLLDFNFSEKNLDGTKSKKLKF